MASETFQIITSALLSCSLSPDRFFPSDYGPQLADSPVKFDFIVVGAGSAGSAVAGRLAENNNVNVLLLEAGDYPPWQTEVPGFSFIHHMGTEYDWQYESVLNNKSCMAFKDNVCRIPRGKCLGGTSSTNGMVYVRGTDYDYNRWLKMGNDGWGPQDVLNYFKKSEDSRSRFGRKHGHDGPLTTTYTKAGLTHGRQFILDAAAEAGVKYYDDEVDFGYFETLSTVRDGQRCSSAKAYLDNTKKNLYIATKAHVNKVLIKNRIAYGVEVNVNGKVMHIHANKEVIVSGGALNSPQILMLSGIGPKAHLKEHGIKVIKNLPVGQNLKDHCFLLTLFVEIDPLPSDEAKDDVSRYCDKREGPLAAISTANMLYFLNTKNKTNFPDIQILHIFVPQNDDLTLPVFLDKIGMNEITGKSITERNSKKDLIDYLITLTHPKSHGWVKLRSAIPKDKPIININCLGEEDDLNTVLAAIPYLEKILKTPAMQERNAKWFFPELPLCRDYVEGSTDYWKCLIRNVISSAYHMTGTCRMGPKDDYTSVVDSRLRVHGIKNLRVIDASAAPSLINRNTNAMAIMIGEKGADLIKEDHQLI